MVSWRVVWAFSEETPVIQIAAQQALRNICAGESDVMKYVLMSIANSFEGLFCGLPVDHELCTEAVVISRSRDSRRHRTATGGCRVSLADGTIDIVELHTGIRVPPPVESKTETLTDTTLDSLIAEIAPRKTSGNLPRTPTASATLIGLYDKEIFVWLGAS